MTPRGDEDDPEGATTPRPGSSGRAGPGDEPPPELDKIFGGSLKQAGPSMDAAYGLVGAILGLGLIGWLCDRWLGSSPKGLITGVLLGVVVGMVNLARVTFGARR